MKKLKPWFSIVLFLIIAAIILLLLLGYTMNPDKTWKPSTDDRTTKSR